MSRPIQHIDTALYLRDQFGRKGTRTAAGYLRNRGWSIESALWILCHAEAR
jgi:hypothetical protein